MNEIRKRREEQDVEIELLIIGQGEWKITPGFKEFKITEEKFYQMTAEQRLRFKERFNTTEMGQPILDSVYSEKQATVSTYVMVKPQDSGIMYLPLPVLH